MQGSLKRFMLMGLVLVISLVGLVRAQDNAEAVPVQGFYFVTASEGTLEEGDNDTYLLTLEDVPEMVDWVVNVPEYFASGYETAVLVSEWTANTDAPLTTIGMLRTEDSTLRFTVGAPKYNAMSETLTLTLSALEAFPLDEDDKDGGIPDDFDDATLTLVLDEAFSAGLLEGAAILEAEGRASRSGESKRPGPPPPPVKR